MFIEKYKWGQGKNTRIYTIVSVGILTAIGCWRLYQKLTASLDVTTPIGLWTSVLVPLIVFAAIGILLYWLINKPVVADFLIAAEGELKKVSFSSKREIALSTFVVIIVVVITAAMLGIADLCFSLFFQNVLGI